MNRGLTKAQASEVMTQLAFYTGWPTTFAALPIVKDVVDKRPNEVFRSKPHDEPAVT
jgi:4-carboxymuconolactone decarboxylase